MRTFLNSILAFIGSESLSDVEFDSLSGDLVVEYSKANYDVLKTVLQAREGVSGQLAKLANFFKAKGVDLTATQEAKTPSSQIFLGAALD